MCHEIQGHECVNSAVALMTALTQQLVPDDIEANSVSFQLHSHGNMPGSGVTRNSGMEFAQSVTALTASISGTTEQEAMHATMSNTSPSTSAVGLTTRTG